MSLFFFTNGRIYSSFRPLVIVESIIVGDAKIEYAGYEEKALEILAGREYERIDLKGRTMMPGFIDAHMHLDELGKSLNIVDLRGTRSIGELKEKVKAHSRDSKGWIMGHGWDQELFEDKRWPNRSDLDNISSDLPIFLSRLDLHSAVLNTKALDELGLLESDESPDLLLRDEAGEITGIVKESMFDFAKRKVDESLTDEQLEKFLTDGIDYATSLGLTSLGFVSCSYRMLKLLEKIRDEGKLSLHISVYINSGDIDRIKEFRGDSMLSLRGVKIFTDGSLGSRTALLSEPYSDAPDTSGNAGIDEDSFLELCRKAGEMNLHIATHAIGNEAIDMVLDVYSELGGRNRIEHLSVLREDQIDRLVQTGTTAVVQPHFMLTDFWILDRIGEERAKWFHPFNTMLKSGVTVAFSTDCPVEPLNPLETIYAAVTRGSYEKIPVYEHSKEETVGIADAMDAYTSKSAEAIGESDTGSLTAGNSADFIILSRNPLFQRESKLTSIRVMETWVGGRKVYP